MTSDSKWRPTVYGKVSSGAAAVCMRLHALNAVVICTRRNHSMNATHALNCVQVQTGGQSIEKVEQQNPKPLGLTTKP